MFIYPVLFLVIGTWFTITRLLMRMSGMTPQLEIETGEPVRVSRWGSALINGVRVRHCARIEEYREGYVVRTMWVFGGGRLWLPKRELQVSVKYPGNFLMPTSRVLTSGTNQVILYDTLTPFVSGHSTDELARR